MFDRSINKSLLSTFIKHVTPQNTNVSDAAMDAIFNAFVLSMQTENPGLEMIDAMLRGDMNKPKKTCLCIGDPSQLSSFNSKHDDHVDLDKRIWAMIMDDIDMRDQVQDEVQPQKSKSMRENHAPKSRKRW